MSTRSIIGTAHDGGFEGRYCHSDGYPTCRGRQIFETYHQLGGNLQALIAYAIRPGDTGYWSSYMTPHQNAENNAQPDRAPCWLCAEPDRDTPSCHLCKGTGTAYNPHKYTAWQAENGDSWATHVNDWGAVWAYLVSESGITVLESAWTEAAGAAWTRIAHIAWTDTPNWTAIECGEQFERCSHYAWAHFPEVPNTDRMSTSEYLARKAG